MQIVARKQRENETQQTQSKCIPLHCERSGGKMTGKRGSDLRWVIYTSVDPLTSSRLFVGRGPRQLVMSTSLFSTPCRFVLIVRPLTLSSDETGNTDFTSPWASLVQNSFTWFGLLAMDFCKLWWSPILSASRAELGNCPTAEGLCKCFVTTRSDLTAIAGVIVCHGELPVLILASGRLGTWVSMPRLCHGG